MDWEYMRSRGGKAEGRNNIWGGRIWHWKVLAKTLGLGSIDGGVLFPAYESRVDVPEFISDWCRSGVLRSGSWDRDLVATVYSMILKVFSGCLLEMITVATPTPVAISTAMSLASISPVPNLDSRVTVLTGRKVSNIEGESTGTRYLVIWMDDTMLMGLDLFSHTENQRLSTETSNPHESLIEYHYCQTGFPIIKSQSVKVQGYWYRLHIRWQKWCYFRWW